MSGPEDAGPGVDLLAESEDQSALRQLAREVAEREVAPRAQVADEEGAVPAEVRKALAAADLLRITVGERWGGMGLGDVEASIVLEEIARADVSSAICCQLTFNGPPRGIEHLGPEAMQERWLPAVADGDALISIGITEPDAGSAVQNMRAALVEDGPGRWRLNAYKNYSTLGDVAQGVLVWCRWPGGEGAKGIGAVIVPTDREGVSVTGRHKGMGIHAATEAELAFDGVEITADDVLLAGDPSNTEAFKVLLSHLNHERCGNASMCVGAAQGALEHAVRYMHERIIGGRPLAELQGLQWKLADMAVQLEGARMLLARAVRLAGPGGTPPALETAMAKTAANLAAKFVCDEAMQIHGGYGYSREYPLERAYRDIRGLCIGAGTVEAQRNYIGLRVAAGARHRVAGLEGPAGRVVGLSGSFVVWVHDDQTGGGSRPLRGQAGLRTDLSLRRVRGAPDGPRRLHVTGHVGQAAHHGAPPYDGLPRAGRPVPRVRALCHGLPGRRHHPGARRRDQARRTTGPRRVGPDSPRLTCP